MFVIKLDNNYYLSKNIDEKWVYTTDISQALSLIDTEVVEIAQNYKDTGTITVNEREFADISILEIEMIIRNEVVLKR